MASAAQYRRDLLSAVRGLWQGSFTIDQFINIVGSAIQRNITRAWLDGAKECGIGPDELSQAERAALGRFILMQRFHIFGLGADIVAARAASIEKHGKLVPPVEPKRGVTRGRIGMWVNRWAEAKTQSSSFACADQKAQWFLGATEKHCRTCAGFHGRVYRWSTWRENGALPQTRRLACGGWRCDCRLETTTAPMSRGKFPRGLLGK